MRRTTIAAADVRAAWDTYRTWKTDPAVIYVGESDVTLSDLLLGTDAAVDPTAPLPRGLAVVWAQVATGWWRDGVTMIDEVRLGRRGGRR